MTSDRTAAMMVTRTRANKAGNMIPTLSIQPADALIDVPRGIRVEHVAPGQTVEITALTRRNGVLWQSHAAFVAGEDGSVDLTRDAPVSGDYAGVSPMGLIWSQSPWTRPAASTFNHSVAEPLVTEIVARAAGARSRAVHAAPGRRGRDAPGRARARPARLASRRADPERSGGGINEPRAALYSRALRRLRAGLFQGAGPVGLHLQHPAGILPDGLRWLRQKVRPSTTSSPSAASRAAANWCCCWRHLPHGSVGRGRLRRRGP